MDFSESPERLALRSSVRRLGERYGHTYYADNAQAGGSIEELWAELGKSGFAGASISEEFGGSGGGIHDLAVIAEELAAVGIPLMTLVVSPAVCGSILEAGGSLTLKERWLPRIGSGDIRMAFAITEADAGSNAHNIRTRGTFEDDGWHLSGSKQFISGLDDAEAVLTVARTGTDSSGSHGQLSLFVVETDRPGLTAQPIPTQVLAPERQFLVTYADVVIPHENLVGTPGGGLQQLFMGLNPERILSAAVCVGLARYALDKASAYARERVVWGKQPIGSHQGVAHPLAKGFIALESARLLMQKAATLHDAGEKCGAEANMAKYAAAEAAQSCLDAAIQTLGGNGMTTEFGLADLWGLTRLYRIAPVSHEMVLNYVSQHLLDLPKSY